MSRHRIYLGMKLSQDVWENQFYLFKTFSSKTNDSILLKIEIADCGLIDGKNFGAHIFLGYKVFTEN